MNNYEGYGLKSRISLKFDAACPDVYVYADDVPTKQHPTSMYGWEYTDALEVEPKIVERITPVLETLGLSYQVSNEFGRKDRRHIILPDENSLQIVEENINVFVEALQ